MWRPSGGAGAFRHSPTNPRRVSPRGLLREGCAEGLVRLRARMVQIRSRADVFAGCAVLSVVGDDSDSAWMGTEGAGLCHYQSGQWSVSTQTEGLSNLFVWSVLETRSKELFV